MSTDVEETAATARQEAYLFYLEDSLSLSVGLGMAGRVADGSVDMVLCDPPFGITARNDWDRQLDVDALFAQIERVTKPSAAVIIFSQGMLTAKLMTGPWMRHYRHTIIWRTNKPRGFLNAKKRPLLYHCDILVFYRRQCTYNRRWSRVPRPCTPASARPPASITAMPQAASTDAPALRIAIRQA
jgi:hypothetical protein